MNAATKEIFSTIMYAQFPFICSFLFERKLPSVLKMLGKEKKKKDNALHSSFFQCFRAIPRNTSVLFPFRMTGCTLQGESAKRAV